MDETYTYGAFVERATVAYGEAEAGRICPAYGRLFARDCRQRAAAASGEDVEVLRRLADQMDPDMHSGGVPSDGP